MKKQNIILVFVLALSLCNMAFAANLTYSYSKSDGEMLNIVVFDSLITIRFDTAAISGPNELAAQYACLEDDFDFIRLPGNFYVFKAEPDRDLAETLALLRADSNVFMVNPVIKTQSGKAIYLTNQIVARYKPEISLDEIDSINAAFGLSIYSETDEYSPCYFLEFNSKTELNIFDISESSDLWLSKAHIPEFCLHGHI